MTSASSSVKVRLQADGISGSATHACNVALQEAGKRCGTCREWKPYGAFAHHGASHDGRRKHCRDCMLSGRRQPKIQLAAKRGSSKKRRSHKRLPARHSGYQTQSAKVRKAVQAANYAVRSGKIPRVTQCQAAGCTEVADLQKHHHDYDKPLDVLWVCPGHHKRGHSIGIIRTAPGIDPVMGRIPERD